MRTDEYVAVGLYSGTIFHKGWVSWWAPGVRSHWLETMSHWGYNIQDLRLMIQDFIIRSQKIDSMVWDP